MGFFSQKNILVTGATGLIGSHLIAELIKKNPARIIAAGRNKQKLESIFAKYLSYPNFQILAHDIAHPIDILDQPIHIIFHAAGPISGEIIKNSPLDVIIPNLTGTQNCLEFLKRQQANTGLLGKIIIFSSATIYGNITNDNCLVSEEDTEITEKITSISASYSQTKRMSEVLTLAYCRQYGINACIARFSYVYGYSYFSPTTAFYEFVKKALIGEDIILNNSVFTRRDNIYIDDAVSGLLCLCQNGLSGHIYNISSAGELGNFCAINEISQHIADEISAKNDSHFRINIIYKNNISPTYAPGIILNNAKLKELGWTLKTDIQQGISKTIALYLENNYK